MLKEMPQVGQVVVAIGNDYKDNVRYITKGKRYEIKGMSLLNGNTHHDDDLGDKIYIDAGSFELYDLVNPFKVVEGLTEDPKVGDSIIGLHDVYDTYDDDDREFEQVRRITFNKKYEVVGIYGFSNIPYIVDDSGQNYYVDKEVYGYFELAKRKVNISPMGLTIDGRDYRTNATDVLLQFKIMTNPDNVLSAMVEFENDVNLLIKNKYSN